MKYPKIEAAYWRIMKSDIFRLNGEAIDLCERLIDLCNALEETETEEDVWSIGEGEEASLDCLLIGAYWALTEWHGGQYSDEYAALSAIGGIYSPGCSSGPEPESSEQSAYEQVCYYFARKNVA